MITEPALDILLKYGLPVALETGFNTSAQAEQIKTGLSVLFLLLLVPVAVALFFILRSIYRHTIGEKLKTTLHEDYIKEAKAYEKSGKYVSAADVYETRLKDHEKAAELYERGGDFHRAATLYDLLGESSKAREMFEKNGNIDNAAGVLIREGRYEDAATLYNNAGKKHDAALLMEKAGRTLAAIRAYREAGDYKNAARLLEAEGMVKEAAEMLGLSLHGTEPDATTLQDFYSYAFRLEKSGLTEKAIAVYKEIDKTDAAYRDVRERLQALSPSAEKEEKLEGMVTIRSFIRSGSTDPKNTLKLWLHILRSLEESYKRGRRFGRIAPDSITIDTQNTITFLDKPPSFAYIAPEETKGLEPDVRADIYSMGIILYEMLTGSLDHLRTKRLADIVPDIPEWLDQMVIRCIRKVREDRYQSINEIFTDIKQLSQGKKESDDET